MARRWWAYILIVAPLVWLLGPALWREQALDFRDVGHYYRPLWQWTSAEWAAGRVPLWCDLDGLGMPVHADPTASLFYPGQLLFALPLGFTTRLNLYVVAHLLLAAALLYRAARAFGASRAGAIAGALSYAYGGHVLFQYCNPIYLVSAAWLPLAVLATERLLSRRSLRWGVALAMALALMILGGDPQLAYHVGLFALLYAWMVRAKAAAETPSVRPLRERLYVLLPASLLLAGLLAAVQLLPTAQWSRRSERAISDVPRSLWELPAGGSVQRGLLGDPAPDSHHERVYDFSVGPWRWLEFAWPNVGGRMFPQHQRWMSALPAEGRVWSPSLYLGLAPLLAALAAFSLRRRAETVTRWLSWMLLLSLLASLGVYGLGWLWEEVRCGLLGGDSQDRPVHGAVGGLYWLLVVALPGYVQFRYPAKWMVLVSLSLALLAARGWDRLFLAAPAARRYWRLALGLLLAGSGVIALAAWSLRGALAELPAEYPFGPFVPSAALRDVLGAALHTAVVVTILFVLARRFGGRAWAPAAAALVTAVELCIAHGWLISSAEPAAFRATPAWPAAARILRGAIDEHAPEEWKTTSSPDRVTEVLAWQYASLGEKCFLTGDANIVDARTALEPADLAAVRKLLKKHPHVQAALAVNWQLRMGERRPIAMPLHEPPWPRVYCPAVVLFREPLASAGPRQLEAHTQSLLLQQRLADERRNVVVVEPTWSEAVDMNEREAFRKDVPRDALLLRRVSPTHLEIDAMLPETRLVVLAEYFAPGWTAEIVDQVTGDSRPGEILRTNRVLRGVFVPAGQQRIILRYRPVLLYLGGALSGLAWLSTALLLIRRPRSAK